MIGDGELDVAILILVLCGGAIVVWILARGDLVGADARKRGIEVTLDLPDTPIQVRGDRDQLAQVALNIALNAVRAIGGGRGTNDFDRLGYSRVHLVAVGDVALKPRCVAAGRGRLAGGGRGPRGIDLEPGLGGPGR